MSATWIACGLVRNLRSAMETCIHWQVSHVHVLCSMEWISGGGWQVMACHMLCPLALNDASEGASEL